MAKLLSGTRIYGTATVDTQLFVSGSNAASSTTSGALQVVGGAGVGGNLYVGGTIYGAILNGTATTATNADNIKTVSQTSSSNYYPTFVDANNATAAYEVLYTTSSFVINPQSGNIGIGNSSPTWKVDANLGTITSGSISTGGFNVTGDATTSVGYTTYNLQLNNSTANASGYMRLARTSGTAYLGMQIGSQSRDGIAFLTSATTVTESMRITAAGNVGIGFTAPNGKLDVAGDLYIGATQNTARFKSDNTNTFVDAIPAAGAVVIRAGGSVEKLRVTANGGVSFGVSGTAYGTSGQILQSNGDAAPTWINLSGVSSGLATTATNLAGGTAGQVPYQTGPGVTSFYGPGTAGNVLVSNGTSAPTYNNTLTLTATTAATSTNSGALQVVGGVGFGGDLFLGGNITQVSGTHATLATTYNLVNTTATTVNFAGAATTLNMGASNSGTTNVRNNLVISGNLTVQGSTTIVDSTVTNIADPILTLGGPASNAAPTADDNKDRGIAFKYVNNAGSTSTGFFGYKDSTGYFTYIATATFTSEVVSGTKGALDANLAGGTAMAIHYQSSQDNTAFLAAGTAGQLLQTNGTGSAPTWVSASGVSAGSATYADQIRTISQAGNASHYPMFVDSNNTSNAYESVYTTSSFSINPSTGFVGIGTNSPSYKLTVAGANNSSTPLVQFNATGTGTFQRGVQLFNTALAAGESIMYSVGTADSSRQMGQMYYVYAGSNSTSNRLSFGLHSVDDVLNILGTGNVGVGTTSPSTNLTIGSTAASGGASGGLGVFLSRGVTTNFFEAFDGTKSYIAGVDNTLTYAKAGTLSAHDLAIVTGNGAKMYITSSTGYVGVGTTTPSQRLEVNGGIKILSSATLAVTLGTGGAVLDYLYPTTRMYIGDGTGWDFRIAKRATSATTDLFSFNDTGALGFNGAFGSSGQVLQSNGSSSPTWVSPSTLASASATNADNLKTLATNTNATFYLSFVDSNNTTTTYEAYYTTSSFSINPSTGSVGIGTTGPRSKFEVVSGTVNTNADAPGTVATFVGATPSGQNSQVSIESNDTIAANTGGVLAFGGRYSGTTLATWAAIKGLKEDATSGNYGGYLSFYTRTNGAGYSERMRITPAGGISFGATGTAYGTSGQLLKSNGNAAPTWVDQSTIAAGSAPLTNTYVGFGSASNLLTGSSSLTWNATTLYVNGASTVTSTLVVNSSSSAIGKATVYVPSTNIVTYADNTSTAGLVVAGTGDRVRLQFGIGSSTVGPYGGWIQASFDNGGGANGNEPLLLNPIGGNVGIGTSLPNNRLVISNGGAVGLEVSVTGGYTGLGGIDFLTYNRSTSAYAPIGFVTNSNNNSMVILTNGNVGIATTTPAYNLHVRGAQATPTTSFGLRTWNQVPPELYVQSSSAAIGAGGSIGFGARDSGATDYANWRIRSVFSTESGGFGANTALLFDAAQDATGTSNLTNVLSLLGNGNVGIGTGAGAFANRFEVRGTQGQLFSVSDSFTGTIFSASDISGIPSIEVLDTGLVKLAQYNGQVTISTGTAQTSMGLTVNTATYITSLGVGTVASGTSGEIRAANEITAYYSSDARLKENVSVISNPIEIVKQIRGVYFDWTDEHIASRGGEDGFFVRKHDVGVIAQEVEAVLPELVATRDNGFKAVKYEKLVALLIEAVKDQQEQIDVLKYEIQELKQSVK